jgi:hypothetical protein
MVEQTFKNIDNVLRTEAGCENEVDYIEQTSWDDLSAVLGRLGRRPRSCCLPVALVSGLFPRRNPLGTNDDHMCAFRHPELTRQTFGGLKAGILPIPNADLERMNIK